MTLEASLYADMLDNFLHGTKKDYLMAERRYSRYLRARRRR